MGNKSSVQRACIARNPGDWFGKEEELESCWVREGHRGKHSGCSLVLFQQYFNPCFPHRGTAVTESNLTHSVEELCMVNIIAASKGRQAVVYQQQKRFFFNINLS